MLTIKTNFKLLPKNRKFSLLKKKSFFRINKINNFYILTYYTHALKFQTVKTLTVYPSLIKSLSRYFDKYFYFRDDDEEEPETVDIQNSPLNLFLSSKGSSGGHPKKGAKGI